MGPRHEGRASLDRAWKSGGTDAAAALYDRYADAVRAFVHRSLGPAVDADDVVHNVFLSALGRSDGLSDLPEVGAWLLGIAARAVLIRLRKQRRQRWLRFVTPEDDRNAQVTPRAELGEAVRDAYAIMDRLTPEERLALVLHRVEGLSLADSATVTRTSLSTFRRLLARGEEKFFTHAKARPALTSWLGEDSAEAAIRSEQSAPMAWSAPY